MKVNLGRLTHIDDVLEAYGSEKELAENLIDLLVDLKHWCAANKVDFDERLRLAQIRYEAELSASPHFDRSRIALI